MKNTADNSSCSLTLRPKQKAFVLGGFATAFTLVGLFIGDVFSGAIIGLLLGLIVIARGGG